MSGTVPSGWAYYDKSANKYLIAGETMPTPADGDMYYSTSQKTNNSCYYNYRASRQYYYNYRQTDTDKYPNYSSFTLMAGWEVTPSEGWSGGGTFAPLSSVAGAPVVSIWMSRGVNLSTVTCHSNIRVIHLNSNTYVQTVNGTISSNLLYAYFDGCTNLKSIPSMGNATQMIYGHRLFGNCTSLTTVPALPPNLEVIQEGFINCTSLVTAPNIPSGILWGGSMFEGCTSLQIAPKNNASNIQYVWRAFKDCINLEDASAFTFYSSILNMNQCFQGCEKLVTPPAKITGTNATAVRMFEKCKALVTPPIFEGTYTKWNTIFWQCSALKTPPRIPDSVIELPWAFAECTSLESVPVIPKSVQTLYYAFYKCTSLTWVSLRINNTGNTGYSMNYMFNGCTNLTGIIYMNGTYLPDYNVVFNDTINPIIIGGNGTVAQALALSSNNNNVYKWLNATYESISSVRCNELGELDDTGTFMKIIIDFTCPIIDYSKIYVPKVYVKNNQLEPVQNWILTYPSPEDEGVEIVKEIPDSTDITVTRIEANDVVAKGSFSTLFSTENMTEGAALKVLIPTSCSQVALDWNDDGSYKYGTFYWNGSEGSAIFTGETYIWDAVPDGSVFKIGGPVYDGEKGFIVGNSGEAEENQYSATFNGPVTFNSNIYIAIDENASSEYLDGRIYDRINALNWSDVLG